MCFFGLKKMCRGIVTTCLSVYIYVQYGTVHGSRYDRKGGEKPVLDFYCGDKFLIGWVLVQSDRESSRGMQTQGMQIKG